jgi:hypothetical protein
MVSIALVTSLMGILNPNISSPIKPAYRCGDQRALRGLIDNDWEGGRILKSVPPTHPSW